MRRLQRWTQGPYQLNTDSLQARGLYAWYPLVGLGGGDTLPNRSLTPGLDLAFPGGTADPAWSTTAHGPTLLFDGTDDYLQVNPAGTLPGLPFTLTAWVIPTALSGETTVIYYGDSGSGSQMYLLGFDDAAPRAMHRFSGAPGIAVGSNVNTGELIHIAGVFVSDSERSIYVNGVLEATSTTTESIPTPDRIGLGSARDSTPGQYLTGHILDARIYSVALIDAEIAHQVRFMWDLYQVAEPRRVVFVPAGGGTQYNQSAAGSLTPAGAIVRETSTIKAGSISFSGALAERANKALAGTLTPAGAIVRDITKSFVGSLTPTGAPTKQTNKPFSGSLGLSGALATVRTFLRSVAGALGLSGALAKQTSKSLTGTLPTSGNLVRQVQKVLAGTLTPSGALSVVRTFLRSVAGTLGLSGAITRQTNKPVAGSLTPTGSIARDITKAFAGALGLAGSIVRQTSKPSSGSLTPSGAVATLRTAFVSLAGTLQMSAAVMRQTNKLTSGTVGLSGTITRSISKLLAGALGLAGNLITFLTGASTFVAEATTVITLVNTATVSVAHAYTATVEIEVT